MSRRRPPPLDAAIKGSDAPVQDASENLDILGTKVGLAAEQPPNALLGPPGPLGDLRMVKPGLVNVVTDTLVNRSGHDDVLAKNDGTSQASSQKLTAHSGVALGVSNDRADERKRPSKEFGIAAMALAKTVGLGPKELASEIGKSLSSVERLPQGKASMEIGLLVKEVLVRKKVDVSALPPLDTTQSVTDGLSDDEREWLRIYRVLSEYAVPAWWQHEYRELKNMADALERQARQLLELSRPK